jgi:hypothetical protein
MKITVKSKEPESLNEIPFPYIVDYCGNIVLITGVNQTNPKYLKGIMINGNNIYKPFQYEEDGWLKKDCVPFHGIITIEV